MLPIDGPASLTHVPEKQRSTPASPPHPTAAHVPRPPLPAPPAHAPDPGFRSPRKSFRRDFILAALTLAAGAAYFAFFQPAKSAASAPTKRAAPVIPVV